MYQILLKWKQIWVFSTDDDASLVIDEDEPAVTDSFMGPPMLTSTQKPLMASETVNKPSVESKRKPPKNVDKKEKEIVTLSILM